MALFTNNLVRRSSRNPAKGLVDKKNVKAPVGKDQAVWKGLQHLFPVHPGRCAQAGRGVFGVCHMSTFDALDEGLSTVPIKLEKHRRVNDRFPLQKLPDWIEIWPL